MIRAELKSKAKQDIAGKIGPIFLIILIFAIACGLVGSIGNGIGSIIVALAAGPITLSFSRIFLDMSKKKPAIKDLLYGFDEDRVVPAFIAYLRLTVFTFLWSLLFFIPGIVKGISYSQMFYIMADNPKLSAKDAQVKSMAMMEGHKWEYFMLQLSFIPWEILTGLTLGIAGVYVAPYMEATMANFYKELAAHKK